MGNQVNAEKGCSNSKSPSHKKSTSFFGGLLSSEKKNAVKSPGKESLYSQHKPFENFDNTEIYGFRLDSDPEDREYYINCPQCNQILLDNGLSKNITCKKCGRDFEIDDYSNENFRIISSKKSASALKNRRTRKPPDLSNLVLLTNRDTLLGNFYDSEQNKINYDLLMKKILLPYFKIKSRVLKNGMSFKIGEFGFKVAGLNPNKKGIVTSKTFIHCQQYYSLNTVIKRALLITMQKYDNFSQEEAIKEILSAPESSLVINKNEISKIRQYEFYVRNCEPDSGVITKDSMITIENKEIMGIAKIKLAAIKNNIPHFQNASERQKYEEYIFQEYFKPYFLSGVKKYVERGDVIQIEDLEIFILNSFPDHGFISADTIVNIKFGLNKEKCLEKINNADNKFAFNLLNIEAGGTPYSNEYNLIRMHSDELWNSRHISHYRSLSPIRTRSLDRIIFHEIVTNPESRLNLDEIVFGDPNVNEDFLAQQKLEVARNLPTFTVESSYLKSVESKTDEGFKKCVICMDDFKLDEVLKTLPCFHIFHKHCIDEWLNSNNQCPICKSAICE